MSECRNSLVAETKANGLPCSVIIFRASFEFEKNLEPTMVV